MTRLFDQLPHTIIILLKVMNSPLFGLLKIKMILASQSAHSAHAINNLTSTNYCAELYPFLK